MGQEIAKIFYGSQNYGLDTPASDKDYKTITLPSVEDVFLMKDASGKDSLDYRKFFKLLLGGNANMLELLFSKEQHFYNEDFKNFFLSLRYYSDNIIRANWKTFSLSLRGKVCNNIGQMTSKEYARFKHHYHLWKTIYENNGALSSWEYPQFKELRNIELSRKEQFEVIKISEEWSPEILKLEPNIFDSEQTRYLQKKAIRFFKENIKDDIQIIFPEQI